jgi:hypothetical protein
MEESKPQVKIGVGRIEFISYYLTVRDKSKKVIWEGLINGKAFKGPDGQPALQPEEVPPKLAQALRQLGRDVTYYSEWVPAWEVIDDGNNETPSQED